MKSYQVHERVMGSIKMNLKMLKFAVIISILIFVSLMFFILTRDIYISGTDINMPLSVTLKYHTGFTGLDANAEVEKVLLPYAKGWTRLPLDLYRPFVDYLTDNAYMKQREHIKYALFFSLAFPIMYMLLFAGKAKNSGEDKFIRGAKMTPLEELNQTLAAEAQKDSMAGLRIGETKIPFSMESRHILVLGTTGSGKGVLLNQLVAQINKRKLQRKTNDRCIFYDVKGEFVAKQFQEGDLIFYPFDARSLSWNIFNEIEILPDFDVISRSLFTAAKAEDEYWYNCAADVFRTGLIYLKNNNRTSNAELWDFFSQSVSDIKDAFLTLPVSEQGAIKHIDKEDSPASSSIISILQDKISFFRYLVDVDGDFSFRKFVRGYQNQETPPNLFLLNIAQYSILFKQLMTLAIDMMCREALSLPDDLNRRLFFVLDELGTLGKIESVIQLETVGRSKGACLICANQDLGRIQEQYGEANLKSFFNNFNTTITFRIKEPETSDFLSKAVGEQQIVKMSESSQLDAGGVGDRKSISEQEKVERLILPSEFQTLPDLSGIISISGKTSKIIVPRIFYPEERPNFIIREFKLLTDLDEAVADKEAGETAVIQKIKEASEQSAFSDDKADMQESFIAPESDEQYNFDTLDNDKESNFADQEHYDSEMEVDEDAGILPENISEESPSLGSSLDFNFGFGFDFEKKEENIQKED